MKEIEKALHLHFTPKHSGATNDFLAVVKEVLEGTLNYEAAPHTLTIHSLYDTQLECSCSWSLTFTGEMSREEAEEAHRRHREDEMIAQAKSLND